MLVRRNLFLYKAGSCVCLLDDYSLLRNLKRGDRRSAKDPVTLTNNSNVKILISIFITRNQRIVDEETRNDWILVWHYQTYKFDRSTRCRSLRWNDWVNRCRPSSYIGFARISSLPRLVSMPPRRAKNCTTEITENS